MADHYIVQPFNAVDAQQKIVKDEWKVRILDPKHPKHGKRIHGYQVRWIVVTADGTERRFKRVFARNAQEPAEMLHRRLKLAEGGDAWADEDGMPISHRTTPTGSIRIDEAMREYFLETERNRDSGKHKQGLETNLRFALNVLRSAPDGLIHYRHGEPESLRAGHESTHERPEDDPMLMRDIDDTACRRLMEARATVDRRAWKGYFTALRKYHRAQERQYRRGPGPRPRSVEMPQPPAERATAPRTVELFLLEMTQFFEWAVQRGYLTRNHIAVIDPPSRKDRKVARYMVPTQDQAWDLADAVGSLPGGARFRVPILVAFELAPRPEEWFAIETDWFQLDCDEPYLDLRWAEVEVASRYGTNGLPIEVRPLKHRGEGDTREVPIGDFLIGEIRQWFDDFGHETGKFVSLGDGGRVKDRSAFQAEFLAPAVQKVFGASSVKELREMTLKTLRKGGITTWLDDGIDIKRAAERSGHSPTTLLLHYAGATEQANGEFRARRKAPRRSLALA
jgi:hypothetical protein